MNSIKVNWIDQVLMNGVGGATWGFRWWNGWVSVTFTVKPPPPSLPPPPISSSTYWRGGRGGRTSWNSNQNGGNLHLISKIIIPVQNWKKQKKTNKWNKANWGGNQKGGKGKRERNKERERERGRWKTRAWWSDPERFSNFQSNFLFDSPRGRVLLPGSTLFQSRTHFPPCAIEN